MIDTTITGGGGEPLARPTSMGEVLTAPKVLEAPAAVMDIEPAVFQAGMRNIRRRRRYFFVTILAYMPLMWLSHSFFPNFRSMVITFVIWVGILFVTAFYSALARCPRCGNYFHMHGMTLMYLRRCLHCQLHITNKN